MLIIEVKKREPGKKLGSLRKNNLIPAVFYGNGKSATAIALPASAFAKIHKAGDTTPFVLKTETGSVDAIVQDVQYDPLTLKPIHIDFLAIDVNKEIEAKVPLEFSGEAPAVKAGLGTLIKVMHDVLIRALPKNLPHHLVVNLDKLQTLEDRILASDIALPSGVSLVTTPTEIIALVTPIKEEAPAPVEPVDLSSIEVIKKGKKEEEGGEEKAAA